MRDANFAITTAEVEFEIAYLSMLAKQPLQVFAFFGVEIERWRNIHCQQIFPLFVAEDVHQGFVEIEETSLGRRNEYSFLDVLEEHAEFVFGLAALGEIFQHVDCPERNFVGIVKRRVGDEEIASKRGVDLLGVTGRAFAIRASRPANLCFVKEISNQLSFELSRLDAEVPSHRAICAQDCALGGMDEDQIGDRVECVKPLPS